jgi:alpha-L-rhamnosidase
VRTKYRSAVGWIASDWEREAGDTKYRFTVPPNTTARIEIESANPGAVTTNGVAAAKAAGVLAEKVEGNRLELTVGSGNYEFRASNPAD